MSFERVGVIGLGYVGLPLAVELGRRLPTVGYDRDPARVSACQAADDWTGEVTAESFTGAEQLRFTREASDLVGCDVLIVAVPTPVDEAHQPDMACVAEACEVAGRALRPGAVVVFESTMYPGATEDWCVPRLERASGLRHKSGFFVAYSPERINPGDQEHRLTTMIKVVAGDTPETTRRVAELYRSFVAPGVFEAASIAVAEAAKVIENTQRDLNIGLMNELSMLFDRLGLDSQDVLDAAATKWNFQRFSPGLVGGHCVGVDPYYLTHKAESVGYRPELILAARRLNDAMPGYVAAQTVKKIIASGSQVVGSRVAVLGVTFKENCRDLRNSKIVDLAAELAEYGCQLQLHDPLVSAERAQAAGLSLVAWHDLPTAADALVLAVPHTEFLARPLSELLRLVRPGGVVVDLKGALSRPAIERAGRRLWRL